MKTIALILPLGKNDYMTDSVLDGLLSFQNQEIKILVSPHTYPTNYRLPKALSSREEFVRQARLADCIFLFGLFGKTDDVLAEEINSFDKTIFIDGSELGKNRRLDESIQKSVELKTYEGAGRIWSTYLKKCRLYFRREKPYVDGIIPLPFGIESSFVQYKPKVKKDIDFVCVFGQEDFPPLRREVRLRLEEFCKKEGLICKTKQTKLPFFNIHSSLSRKRFRKLLARAKVGISVGGGGFDTMRFWEILGNNCILMTEKIAIYKEGSRELDYKRIVQFNNLQEFTDQLKKVSDFIKNEYQTKEFGEEYKNILEKHSSLARVKMILAECHKVGIF